MYKLIKSPITQEVSGVLLTGENHQFCIPFDPANVDFQQYQKWLSDGNQPLPADEPNA